MILTKVRIFTMATCEPCREAKRFLNETGVPYREFDVFIDPGAMEELKRLSGGTRTPVIQVEDEVIVGFDREKLRNALDTAGL